MSADNVIYIKKRGKKWWVWEQSASCEINSKGMKPKKFKDREDADEYAWELEKYYGYVEYGIQEFGWQKPINWDVIDAIEQFKMKEKLK